MYPDWLSHVPRLRSVGRWAGLMSDPINSAPCLRNVCAAAAAPKLSSLQNCAAHALAARAPSTKWASYVHTQEKPMPVVAPLSFQSTMLTCVPSSKRGTLGFTMDCVPTRGRHLLYWVGPHDLTQGKHRNQAAAGIDHDRS